MAVNIAEFISILRKIRDEIYPEISVTYESALLLKVAIDSGLLKLNQNLEDFAVDYQNFLSASGAIDVKLLEANAFKNKAETYASNAKDSADESEASALLATNKVNEIKGITAQASTLTAGSAATASYNNIDGKLTFGIPAGSKGDKGDSFTVNAIGTTAQKTLYDAQPLGFSFLDITTSLIYFKKSNTNADWSTGIPFGKGDTGNTGEQGVGIASIAFLSTTHASGLAGQSGGNDTYKITLTNSTTFNILVHNGIDSTLSNATPIIAGTGTAGVSVNASRADHVHPAQTSITGNSATATKLATARTITLSGDVTGSVAFDGSANVAITAVVVDDSHAHNTLTGLTATIAELNTTDGVTSNIQAQLNAKAPLGSPALSGTPTAPTAAVGTNTTQVATTAFVLANSDIEEPYVIGNYYESTIGPSRWIATVTPTKKHEYKVKRSGTLTVVFTIISDSENGEARGRIYVNGVARGTLRSGEGTYTENITVQKYDLLQIYVWGGSNVYSVKISSSALYCNNPTTTSVVVL